MWLALEDATVVNGCLWAIPGSQKSNFSTFFSICDLKFIDDALLFLLLLLLLLFLSCSVLVPDGLVRRFIRGEDGVYFDQPSPSYDQKEFVPIEVKAGSLVVIHGDLIHQRLV